ncbi:MAG: YCF48-related protein [Saprospiraceae bacterium]|nr:YCF48-related protein [Saprospiraceae bacterium]
MYTKPFFLLLVALLSSSAGYGQARQLFDTPVYALFAAGDTVYAATADRVFRSTDHGATWDTSGLVHQGENEVTDLFVDGATMYATTVVDGVYLSIDGGASWQAHHAGLNGLGARQVPMMARRGDSLYLATLGAGVFVKPLLPVMAPWVPFNAGLPWGTVQSIVHDGRGNLLAGAGGNATVSIRNSADNGWSEWAFDVFNGEINLFLNATREGNALLGAGTQGLYRSVDDGRTWVRFNPGIGLINQAAFTTWNGQVVAGLSKVSSSFLFTSADAGLSWALLDAGMPPTAPLFDVQSAGGALFIARSDGLWRMLAPVSTNSPRSEPQLAGQPFPNPASGGAVHIPVALPESSAVHLAVFDRQGRRVSSQDAGLLPAGEHRLRLDVQELIPGSYMCTLQAGGRQLVFTLQIMH